MRRKIVIALLAVAPGLAQAGFGQTSLPAFFIPNAGQAEERVRYMVDTPQFTAGFTATGAIFRLGGAGVEVNFRGANPQAVIDGEQREEGAANFLIGNRPADWKTALPVYERIRYRDLYPGIDMTYAGMGPRIKSEFLVAAGADPKQIRLEYPGAQLTIEADGDLVIRRESAELREDAPVVYQDDPFGARTAISARYTLLDSRTAGFEIGGYDPSLPLVIDPAISFATYFGGSNTSAVTGLALDLSGDLYVTGWTAATNFHIVVPEQASNGGGVDAFVAKLNPAGTSLLYATYIGGIGDDQGEGIIVDSSGEAYVTGSTTSSNFPAVSALSSRLNGGRDAFVLKLNSIGNTLIYSTYLGGSSSDWGYAITIDGGGNAYVVGDTMSANFPTHGAVQATFGGNQNAFVTKLSSTGAIVYSTFLGGSGVDHASAIALDTANNAYIAGGTTSTNFPVVGPFQATNGGSEDAFLAKLSSSGSQIVYSTYLGGSGGGNGSPEQATGVAVDLTTSAYIVGVTNSTNFPVTAGAFQTRFNSIESAFVAKVSIAGNSLMYCTLLGGSAFNWATGLAILGNGSVYVAGYTSSADFPTVAPIQSSFGGLYDAFVSVLTPTGNSLAFSTFFGGTGADAANAIAIDYNGNIDIGGQTSSQDLTTLNPIQASNSGGAVGWLARIGFSTAQAQLPAVTGVTPASGSGNAVTLTATFSDPAGFAALASTTVLVNGSASPNYGCQVTYLAASNQFSLANDVASSGGTLANPGGGSVQNDQCTLNASGSSVNKSGNTLVMVVSVTFQPGFTGSDTTYLSATDINGNTTGQVASGTWTATVPAPQPTASSVSPNSGLGSSQTFTFAFTDTQNALNITGMAMLFNSTFSYTNACYIVVDTHGDTVALVYDNDTGSNSKPITSTILLSNSQCTVGATSLTVSGLSYILTVALTFQGSFSGQKNIYMYGSENGIYTTGWVQMGTYTVAAGGVPIATSVSPSSGSGPTQRFSFTVSDAGGSGFSTGLAALFAPTLSTTNACSIVYDRTANTIALAYDNPANGAAPVTPGGTQIVSNSQCTLKAADSTVVIGVTSLVVTVDLTFNADFFGAKNIYLDAAEIGVSSGYVNVGSWTVIGGAAEANSVSPASGTGLSPSFTFTVSDSNAAANISGLWVLITSGSPANTANACYLTYSIPSETISLFGNTGSSTTSKPLGSSATLANSQCAVGYTVANTSGNSVALQVNLQFSNTFIGPQTVYLNAIEPSSVSGWVAVGNWTP